METAKKKLPRGRPFTKGDERINRDGRPKAVGTAALRRVITDADLEAMWRQTIRDAKNGDKDARRDILDRLEGRPVHRQEQGNPGAFADLSDVDDATLHEALRRIK